MEESWDGNSRQEPGAEETIKEGYILPDLLAGSRFLNCMESPGPPTQAWYLLPLVAHQSALWKRL